jgi:hypothetical protein
MYIPFSYANCAKPCEFIGPWRGSSASSVLPDWQASITSTMYLASIFSAMAPNSMSLSAPGMVSLSAPGAAGPVGLGPEILGDQIEALALFSRSSAMPGEINEDCVFRLRGLDLCEIFGLARLERTYFCSRQTF